MNEPSVLDYLKSLLMPWKGERISIPQPDQEQGTVEGGEMAATVADENNPAAGQGEGLAVSGRSMEVDHHDSVPSSGIHLGIPAVTEVVCK